MGTLRLLALLLLGACTTYADSYCVIDSPIFFQKGTVGAGLKLDATDPLVKQIVAHNERYEAVCGPVE